jgi:hypothetical protein
MRPLAAAARLFALTAQAPAHAQPSNAAIPSTEVSPITVDRGTRWLKLPTGRDFALAYPVDAQYSGMNARTVMRCAVLPDGHLRDCKIVSELPPGHGFGRASLRLVPLFQLDPKYMAAHPDSGGVIDIPLTWRVFSG